MAPSKVPLSGRINLAQGHGDGRRPHDRILGRATVVVVRDLIRARRQGLAVSALLVGVAGEQRPVVTAPRRLSSVMVEVTNV